MNGQAQQLHEIKEVVIEEKVDASALQQQKESGASSLVISARELNNLGHKTAGDVLRRMPRIILQGPPSFNRNIMMAGLEKEFQAVLINGERPAGGEDSRDFKLDRLPLSMIDKIEVTYNPPVDAGGDAAIGLVNIILKDAPDERGMNAFCTLDRTTTAGGLHPEMGLSYGNRWNKLSLLAGYNFNTFDRKNVTALHDTLYHGETVEDVDVTIHGLTATLSYQPDTTQTWKVQSLFSHYFEELDFLGDIKRRSQGGLNLAYDSAVDLKYRILHTHTLSYLRKTATYGWKTELTLAQHFDQKDRWRMQEKSDGPEVTFEDEDQINSEVILKSKLDRKLRGLPFKNKVNGGIRLSALDRDYDRLAYTKMESHTFWDVIEDGSYTLREYRASAFAGAEGQLGKLWMYPAIRLDKDVHHYTTATRKGAGDYLSLNPSLHLKYQLSTHQFIKADAARQISRPPFNLTVPVDKVKNKKELIERGNPDLKPSRAWNMSLSLENYFGAKSYVLVRGFYTLMRDVVETKAIGIDELYGYRIYQSVNIDSGKVWGMDLSARLELIHSHHNTLQLWGNVSHLGSEVRDPGTLKLRPLNEQPRWIVNTSVDYLNTRAKIQCSMGLNYIGERSIAETVAEDVYVDKLIEDPVMQVDARIKYFIGNWGSVYLNLVNIFDEQLNLVQGSVHETETMGRNLILGMNVTF